MFLHLHTFCLQNKVNLNVNVCMVFISLAASLYTLFLKEYVCVGMHVHRHTCLLIKNIIFVDASNVCNVFLGLVQTLEP